MRVGCEKDEIFDHGVFIEIFGNQRWSRFDLLIDPTGDLPWPKWVKPKKKRKPKKKIQPETQWEPLRVYGVRMRPKREKAATDYKGRPPIRLIPTGVPGLYAIDPWATR